MTRHAVRSDVAQAGAIATLLKGVVMPRIDSVVSDGWPDFGQL